ncbi:MAG: DNA primase [Phascolarctobacterium sp.]|nr:MAG: DNA primase [Phascolarctobacterium sp.]
MSSMFDDFKEQVRSQANIVEIVSEYVPLKKRGSSYWGCCPFHGEKTPSFSVSPDKNFFYCFGCHAGGDVFTFIMKEENCTFQEALKILANKLGIPIPEREKTKQEIEREKEAKEIIAANELATRFYQACLAKSEYGKIAQRYLAGRGITPAIIEKFSIGVSLPVYTSLVKALGKRGCKPELLIKAGLAVRGRNGAYDKFRGRVMIPIEDARGHVVGFGGRTLEQNTDTAKYMNTAETEWFNKRTLLFGLHAAFKEIKKRRQAIIVEGYMDAISLHAAGIDWAVASMGTAFSAEQAKLLARVCDEVVFSYDSDEAGLRADVRAVSIARGAGLKVRVLAVPDGKDPDEFVRKHGTDAYLELIKNASDGIDFQMRQTIAQNNVSNLAGKVEAVSNILPFLLECKNDIEVAGHIRRLAQLLTIDESLIVSEYRKLARKNGRRVQAQVPQPQAVRVKGAEDEAERQLLNILAKNLRLLLLYRDKIEQAGFQSPEHEEIYTALAEQLVKSPDGDVPAELFRSLNPQAAAEFAAIMAKNVQPGDEEKLIADCIRTMNKGRLEALYEKHRMLADEYERLGDSRFLQELAESQKIKDAIKNLY